MRIPLKILSLIALLAASAVAAGDESVGSAAPPLAFPPLPVAIAAKQAKLVAVVAELRSRDVRDWSEAKLAARHRALDLLEAYALRGEFTLHHSLWPREIPLFIDEFGTRCALASVLDGFGRGELVVELAQTCNDAYLNEIEDDSEVGRALDELGLTVDEAAYIQGPGIRRESPSPQPPADVSQLLDLRPQTGDRPGPGGSGAPAGGPTTGAGPSTPPGNRGSVSGAARHATSEVPFTVDVWWQANLDRFLAVRDLYRGDLKSTPTTISGGWRVGTEDRRTLRAKLAELVRDDPDLRATALGMWSRTSQGDDAVAIVDRTLAFLKDEHQRDREWAPVLLAMLSDPAASPSLKLLVADDPKGRALMNASAPVPESVRAMAAIALGQCGDAVPTLAAVLRDQPAAHTDLASACVIALGLAARRPAEHFVATTTLLAALDDGALPAMVVAQVPAALTLAEARAALPRLFDVVQRFRGPRELRAACAHALGALAQDPDDSIFDALLALAKRDVDVEARQAAITALGELAAKSGAGLDPAQARTLAAFLTDGVQGRLRHAVDVPWHALASGLFVRGGNTVASELLPVLRSLAEHGAALDARSAALLALGLARDAESLPMLQAELASANVTSATVNAVYALGLVGARAQRGALLTMCTGSNDPRLGYAAGYALGCVADPMVIAPMVEALSSTRSDAVRGSLARALGEIGDRRSLEGLEAIAFDPARDDPTRERALAALGVAAQRGDVAWNAPLRHALFLGTTTPTLQLVCELF